MSDAPAERMAKETVWTLPAAWYREPEVWERERRTIFAREWLWVGREAELDQPGDYLTAAPAGYPILVLRGTDGALRAFHNVCRHRAGRLLTEPGGHCAQLVCPYHGWRYDLDGTLHTVPNFGEAPDFPRDRLDLFPIAVDVWAGAVFVNLDPAAESLATRLGALAHELASAAPRDVVFHRQLRFDVACNWKNYVDNYQEGYHIPLIHPGLKRDLAWTRYRVRNVGRGSLHEAAPKDGSPHAGVYGWIFPNVAFNVYAQGLSFLRMEPHGPGHTRLVYDYFRRPDVPAEEFAAVVAYGIEVTLEDQWITPLVQRNLDAGIYESGPLSPKHENGVYHFHEMVRAALGVED